MSVIKKPTYYKVPHFNFALYQLWPWISTASIYEGCATSHFTDTVRSKETVLSTVRATTHQQKQEMTILRCDISVVYQLQCRNKCEQQS